MDEGSNMRPEVEVVNLWMSLHPKSGFRPTEYQARKWLNSYSAEIIERAIRAVDSTGSSVKVFKAVESCLLHCSCVDRAQVHAPKVFTEEDRKRMLRDFETVEAKHAEVQDALLFLDSWYTILINEETNEQRLHKTNNLRAR